MTCSAVRPPAISRRRESFRAFPPSQGDAAFPVGSKESGLTFGFYLFLLPLEAEENGATRRPPPSLASETLVEGFCGNQDVESERRNDACVNQDDPPLPRALTWFPAVKGRINGGRATVTATVPSLPSRTRQRRLLPRPLTYVALSIPRRSTVCLGARSTLALEAEDFIQETRALSRIPRAKGKDHVTRQGIKRKVTFGRFQVPRHTGCTVQVSDVSLCL